MTEVNKEREAQLCIMLTAGIRAQWERLDDQKNASKGVFPRDIEEIKKFINEEKSELDEELDDGFGEEEYDYVRIREEAADLKNYLDNLIMVCDKEIAEKKQKIV
jgi:hypothetical protein